MSFELYNGDCLEILRSMPSNSVDCVITDPPFGVRKDEWDAMDEHEFARFSMAWMAEAKRIAPEAIIFCTEGSVIEKLAAMIYPRTRKSIWHKPLGSQYAGSSESRLWFSYEVILHCYDRTSWEVVKPKDMEVANLLKEAREKVGMSRGAIDMVVRGKKTGLCYRWEEAACLPTPEQVEKLKTVLPINGAFTEALQRAITDKEDTLEKAAEKASENAARKADVFIHRTSTKGIHPCEKPEPLMRDVIETLGAEYKTILDPFMGSGSTGVAALLENRKFIGIEKDETYFAIAKKRIEEVTQKEPLFA